MSRHITYQTEQITAPISQAVPRDDLGPKLVAAMTVGLGVFIITLTIIILIISTTGRLALMPVLYAVVGSAVLGVLVTSTLTVAWSLNVAQRQWLIDSKERRRRWKFEDEDRDRATQIAEDAADREDHAPIDYTRIPMIAFEILQRHYAGRPTTRKTCEDSGLCTQAEWNMANRVFKATGLKRRYKLEPGETLDVAWQIWQQRVELYEGQLWLKDRNGKRKELIA